MSISKNYLSKRSESLTIPENEAVFWDIVFYMTSFEKQGQDINDSLFIILEEIEGIDSLGMDFLDFIDNDIEKYCKRFLNESKNYTTLLKILMYVVTPALFAFFYSIMTALLTRGLFTSELIRFYDIGRIIFSIA